MHAWKLRRLGQEDKDTAKAILDLLIDYNAPWFGQSPPSDIVQIAAHDADGKLIGGLLGEIRVWWLHVSILVCAQNQRKSGLGTALMAAAERIAREQDCQGIWLDTFDFQAPGFYERLGFRRCGTIEKFYNGQDRHIYEKRL